MTIDKIVIKELSNKAEIINIFNCNSGDISVIKGTDVSINSLERALSQTYEKNDLKISINDSETYNSNEHTLIGFNDLLKDSTKSVDEVFKNNGFDNSDIDVILNTYGLHNIRNLKIYELDDDKKKRLEYAIGFQNDNKALIIKNPFKDIISQWKEPIAKYISTYASKKNLPVIIMELDYEPSFWKNNDSNIKNYKLGIARTKTIGFGTNNQDLNDFLKQIRNEINNQNSSTTNEKLKATQDPIKINNIPISNAMPEILKDIIETNDNDPIKENNVTNQFNKKDLHKIHVILFGIGILFLVLSLVIVAMLFKIKSDTNLEEIKKRNEIIKRDIATLRRTKKIVNTDSPYILDNYPEWVKHEIELQLKQKEILKSKSLMPLIRNKNQQMPKKADNNLFKLLEEVSGSGKDLPDNVRSYQGNSSGYNYGGGNSGSSGYNNNPSQGSSNLNQVSDAETKRQLLYQRFQEAIKRSRENSKK